MTRSKAMFFSPHKVISFAAETSYVVPSAKGMRTDLIFPRTACRKHPMRFQSALQAVVASQLYRWLVLLISSSLLTMAITISYHTMLMHITILPTDSIVSHHIRSIIGAQAPSKAETPNYSPRVG